MRVVATLLLATALVWSGAARAQTDNPGGPMNQHLGDMDYGVCRGVDPVCYHDWGVLPKGHLKVLLFTHTGGPRHITMGPLLGPGLNPPLQPANKIHLGMLALAARNGFELDYTEDLRELNNLMAYNAVIFYNTARQALDDNGQTQLKQYIRAGGGFMAIHNAFGGMYNWPYYEGLLGNANFYNHRQLRDGTVVLQDVKDASTRDLPKTFRIRDEFYNLIPFPTKVRFLATVDEASWDAEHANGPGAPLEGGDPGHGTFHPVAWCQYYDGGRAFMTTLGHDGNLFDTGASAPSGAREFQTFIAGAIKSLIGLEPFCR